MLTAQEIRDVKFSKSIGGYKTSEVDIFLDECAETVALLTGANEENTRKMQVLAESIVEYRNREDSIRTALLSAQRMSDTVLNEANEKAAQIVAKAQEDAAVLLENAKKEIADELKELQRIKNEVAAFRARLLATYREHLTLIGVLEEESCSEEESETTTSEPDEPFAEEVGHTEEQAALPETEMIEQPFSTLTPDEVPVPQAVTEEEPPVKFDLSAFELKEEE